MEQLGSVWHGVGRVVGEAFRFIINLFRPSPSVKSFEQRLKESHCGYTRLK